MRLLQFVQRQIVLKTAHTRYQNWLADWARQYEGRMQKLVIERDAIDAVQQFVYEHPECVTYNKLWWTYHNAVSHGIGLYGD